MEDLPLDKQKLIEAQKWIKNELNVCADFWLKNGMDKAELQAKYPRIGGIPFDSDRKLMSVICDFDGKKIEMEEIHRFLNEPVEINGALYWDILRLYHELKQGIVKADQAGGVDSMGIDTWGVDFGLIGKDGQLLANPFHYRCAHTENAVELLEEKMPQDDLFAETGIAFQKFNTLCQLAVMKKNAVSNAEIVLNPL